jgi:hypothetical protein
MGERNLERTIHIALENSIGAKGAREDDDFVIEAFQERKKTFRLKRFRYLIKTANRFSFDFTRAEIYLPVFEKVSSEFELVLIKPDNAKSYDHRSRYLLRSLGVMPFKLNGIFTYEAFVERGDAIDIGFNRIHFKRPASHLKLETDDSMLSPEMMTSSLNVMIEGETGTGKTTLAKSVHESSKRPGQFIHLNLSSFSPALIESELFGHVKGAFTGAINEKKGAILEANKGTLFLDEIDSLSLELQTKLLLFLDSHEVRAVGGNHTVKADVRLIFASGTVLKKLVAEEKMRRDFYYRLTSGIVVSLESLRLKPKKIREYCLEFEREQFCVLSEDVITFYCGCPWPGNLRQLFSHLQKKKILAFGKKIILDRSDYALKDECVLSHSVISEMKTLEQMKMDYCFNVYNKAEQNISKASKLLEISPNTLKAMLEKLRGYEVVDIDV